MVLRPILRAARRTAVSCRMRLMAMADMAAGLSEPGRPREGSVLVVRLDAIGDFILWMEAAKALRIRYPEGKYHLTLLANRAWAPLAERLGCFDSVWPLDRARFASSISYRLGTLIRVRKEGFQIAVQPTYSREYYFGDSVVRASGASERVGSVGDHSIISRGEKKASDGWYTRLVPADEKPMMELIRNAEFMRGLGVTLFRATVPLLDVNLGPPVGFNARDYFVLFPGASWYGRRWPAEKFSGLARRIFEATGWTGVICGGPEEGRIGEDIIELTPGVPLENWAGRTSIEGVAGVIRRANLLVGNETSAVHIAAAVNTPSVCILGGGHFGRFLPYRVEVDTGRPVPVSVYSNMDCFNCGWKCGCHVKRNQSVPCIDRVSVDDAWAAVRGILDKEKANNH